MRSRLLSYAGPMYTVADTWRPLVMPNMNQYSQRVHFLSDMSDVLGKSIFRDLFLRNGFKKDAHTKYAPLPATFTINVKVVWLCTSSLRSVVEQ